LGYTLCDIRAGKGGSGWYFGLSEKDTSLLLCRLIEDANIKNLKIISLGKIDFNLIKGAQCLREIHVYASV